MGFRGNNHFGKIYITDNFLLKKISSGRLGVKAFNDITFLDFQANDIYCAASHPNIADIQAYCKLGIGMPNTFVDGDDTPTVQAVGLAQTANSGATTITQFDNPNMGQELTIIFGDNNTTVQHGVNIFLSSGGNKTFATGQTLKLIYCQLGGAPNWYQIGGEI